MNKLILATGSNLGYISKIRPYLDSIESNSNFDLNYLIFLGNEDLVLNYSKIQITNVFEKDLDVVPINYCIQHGEFFKSKKFIRREIQKTDEELKKLNITFTPKA